MKKQVSTCALIATTAVFALSCRRQQPADDYGTYGSGSYNSAHSDITGYTPMDPEYVRVSKAEPGPECYVRDTIEGDIDNNYEELRREAAELGANYVVMDAMDGDDIIARAFRCPDSFSATPTPERLATPLPASEIRVTKNEPHFECTVIDTVSGDEDDNYEELREEAAKLGANLLIIDGKEGATQHGVGGPTFGGDMIGRAVYCPPKNEE